MTYFDHATIIDLHHAALVCQLPREGLLAGVDPHFVSQLSDASTPGARLLTDLHTLNSATALADGTIPLKLWLTNAAALSKPRAESAKFERFLAEIGKPAAEAREKFNGLLLQPAPTWASPATGNTRRFKMIALDLDGTLLRSRTERDFKFSWELIWDHAGVSKTIRKRLSRQYVDQSALDGAGATARVAAYQAWCDSAVGFFKKRGLTRAQLAVLAERVRLTNGCRETLARLREQGMVIAIISGGVQTFLEDCFPDYRDYVDFVFINKLTFAPDGKLTGVEATAYDFEGKRDAFDLVCARAGCDAGEAVMVGDQFNDHVAVAHAGFSIAYTHQETQLDAGAHVRIEDDDLSKILPHVLVE